MRWIFSRVSIGSGQGSYLVSLVSEARVSRRPIASWSTLQPHRDQPVIPRRCSCEARAFGRRTMAQEAQERCDQRMIPCTQQPKPFTRAIVSNVVRPINSGLVFVLQVRPLQLHKANGPHTLGDLCARGEGRDITSGYDNNGEPNADGRETRAQHEAGSIVIAIPIAAQNVAGTFVTAWSTFAVA